jgi:hypothetical protein
MATATATTTAATAVSDAACGVRLDRSAVARHRARGELGRSACDAEPALNEASERWVTSADAEADLLRSPLLAFEN